MIRSQRSEVRGQKSEVRGLRSEVKGQRSEVRGQRSEVRGLRSEVRGLRSEVRGQRSEVKGQRSEVKGQRSEVRGQRSEVRGQRSEVKGLRSEIRGQRSEIRGQRSVFSFKKSDIRRQLTDSFTAYYSQFTERSDPPRLLFIVQRLSFPFSHLLLFTILLLLANTAVADLFGGRVYTEPHKIYVNQPFNLFLEMEVTRGRDIENIRIQGLPNNPKLITLGQLVQERSRQTRHRKDGEVVDVLRFHSEARCHTSISQQFNPILSCDIMDRHSHGFFSFSSSSTKRIRLSPFTLTVHKLPQKGRPAGFSGAVGEFKLNGTLSKSSVRPGDIITLSLELNGTGWLNNAPAPAPANSDNFKCYPPKEILREKNRIRTEQIFIPNSTNAVAIAPAVFNYFNPGTEKYEQCSTPEFKLQFITEAAVAQTNRVNVITLDDSAIHPSSTVTITAREVNTAFHKLLPVAAACLTLLAASFVFLTVVKLNKWIAVVATLLTASAGGLLSFKSTRHEPVRKVTLKGQTEVYLAPSRKAPLITQLRGSTKVTPLENTACWTRIDAEGRRGWVENSALAE